MAWTKQILQDHYFKEAKKLGYVSRAAFKLKEIQRKHRVIKPGGQILDLGCAPGAWMQVACQELGPMNKGGLVLGIDIQEAPRPGRYCDQRVQILQADARTLTPADLQQYSPKGFSAVLSDMLHFTSGVNDVELSLELAATALNLATGRYYFDKYGANYIDQSTVHEGVLQPGGGLVMKIYEGSGTSEFMREMQPYFSKVHRLRVEASRSMSREFYAIGLGRKAPPARSS